MYPRPTSVATAAADSKSSGAFLASTELKKCKIPYLRPFDLFSRKCIKGLEYSRRFKKVQEGSRRFKKVQEGSGRFRKA